MAESFSGTSFDKSKGEAGLSEVEELIRQTLEESKKLEKPAAAPVPASPTAAPQPKKEEFKATTFTPPVSKPAPAPNLPAAPAEKTKTAAPAEAKPTEYEATFKEYKVGDLVKGKVLKLDPSGVLVDIKYKADGLILPEELSDHSFSSPEEIVKVGDIILVEIQKLENKEGYILLSKKAADYERKWRTASDAYRNRTLLEAKVLQALKGGLVVEFDGIRGFVPASQVSKNPEETLESFAGKTIPVKVIEVNPRQGKITLSNRLAAGEKGKLETNKLFDELEVGQVRHGKVANLKNFGAFVDLGGVEGLIHLSELSWKRVKHPSEVLKSGEEIDVFVLGIDKVNKKVSLGLKELQPDPWANAADLYKPGQIVKAKVLRFAKFGAFVELEQGLEGLVHISELSKEPLQNPADARLPDGQPIKIGDMVEVKVLRVTPDEQRIGLSVKAVFKDREKKERKPAAEPAAEEKKVTIGDMIAEKERQKAEREAQEDEKAETEAEFEAGAETIKADQADAPHDVC
ncbi:MAG TPA: 30S ribosomal protein S1 [Candidatus Sulfotelmatobacter sp.]|nr:30S ribosomal protein S1 [Candidatus Sulfotelmatobacter sp.]